MTWRCCATTIAPKARRCASGSKRPEGTEYRHLGNTGARIAALSLGTGGQWGGVVDQAAAKAIVAAALDVVRDRVVLGTKGCQRLGEGENAWGASRYNLMNALGACTAAHRPRGPVPDPPA